MSAFECNLCEIHGAATYDVRDGQGNIIEPFSVEAETENEARKKARAEVSRRLPGRQIVDVVSFSQNKLTVLLEKW